jgi:parallel beta-helix repeat protein
MNVLHNACRIVLVALLASACSENMTNESGPNDPSNPVPSFLPIPGAAVVIDFENPPYTAGSVNGQDGWSSTGPYDQAVVTNSGAPASFGAQSFRISNAVASGSFGDQTFSKRLVNAAGETGADEAGYGMGGVRQNHFEAQWQFASLVPGAEQSGLAVSASPDRGDGSRMSFVRLTDKPAGLAVDFVDVQGKDPGAPLSANFVETAVATGLSRTVPHTIKMTMDLLEGPGNDVVKVYVDGVLRHTGTSWEDYFRSDPEAAAHAGRPPIVNRMLFRAGGTSFPANLGKGFLIDNLALKSSSPTPTATPCTFTTAGNTMTLDADCTTSESISIPDGFTLNGANHTITAVDPASGQFVGGVVINEGPMANVTRLNLTASGLDIACHAGDDRLRGILFDGASGSITHSSVIGVNQAGSGCQEGNGIEVRDFDGNGTTSVVAISHNTVDDYQKGGIICNGEVDCSIEHNKVGASATQANLAANSVQLAFGAAGNISDNRITGNSWCGATGDDATAILLYQTAAGVVVENNKIDGNSDVGIYGFTNGATITKNKVSDVGPDCSGQPDDIGIVWAITGLYSNTLTKNTVSGFDTPYDPANPGGKNKVKKPRKGHGPTV